MIRTSTLRISVTVVVLLAAFCNGAPRFLIFENTPENIARLQNLQPDEHPEELSGQFEGDMILTDEQYLAMFRRNGMSAWRYRWPNNTVFYELEEGWYNTGQIQLLLKAMKAIEDVTCIRYRKRVPELNPDYIRIHASQSGCFSTIGHRGGRQNLNLSRGCFRLGVVIHELLHGIGFLHMQSAYNRDGYVKIVTENIKTGREHNFRRYNANSDFGTGYDYGSILHYSPYAFSVNGKATIVALKENGQVMGQRSGMSEKDILKINRMYNCISKL